jgi:hypothetical protein
MYNEVVPTKMRRGTMEKSKQISKSIIKNTNTKTRSKIKVFYDSEGEPWPFHPSDPQLVKLQDDRNSQEIQDRINATKRQIDIQNDYFRKWKYEKTLKTNDAIKFYEGELYKFEVLHKGQGDPIIDALNSTIEGWEILKELCKNRIPIIKRYLEELKACPINNNAPQTDWQKHLMNGFLYTDGKRVVESLEKTAREYVKHTKTNITERFISENFLNSDGSKYSKSAIKKARDYANS